MTELQMLSKDEVIAFDLPPILNQREREDFFALPDFMRDRIKSMRRDIHKIGYALTYTYFKICKRFFKPVDYREQDIEYACRQLNISVDSINLIAYHNSSTYYRHKKIILEYFAFQSYESINKNFLIEEIDLLARKVIRPKRILFQCIDFLKEKQIEIPGFSNLSKLITDRVNQYEKELVNLVEKEITESDIELLEYLTDFDDEYQNGKKTDVKLKRYRLTSLKSPHHSIRVSAIRKTLKNFKLLLKLHTKLSPVIEKLSLPLEVVQYYGTSVIKSDVFRITIKEAKKKYFYLLCFVIHQYYQYQDILSDVIIQSARRMTNHASREQSEQLLNRHKKDYKKIKKVVDRGTKKQLQNYFLNLFNKI